MTGIASLGSKRQTALVYLDAIVPEVCGSSLFGQDNPERMAHFQPQIAARAQGVDQDNCDA